MNVKEITNRGYELFGKGDMATFFNELIYDNCVWTFPGKDHPLSGAHAGKEAMMQNFAKIPQLWDNFKVTPDFMIAEGNKVFTKINASADGMDTIFGHYFEVNDHGKITTMMTFDDSLSMHNAMKS
jgi:ketosteroid isomerase-like protein